MNKKIVLGSILFLGLMAAGCNTKLSNVNDVNKKVEETKMMQDKTSTATDKMMTDDSSMKKEDSMMNEKHGSYLDYSENTIKSEQAKGNRVILFFHATWCPYCKAADLAFKTKLNEIPNGVTILKTDYDTNASLKQKYAVTYQHTFVQIDNQGELVSKWNGGDIDNLIKYIK